MRVTVISLMQLLQARNEAKRLARSTSQTTIQATENNPLKFSPTAEDAMRILFGPKTRSYLDAQSAFAQGFDDLKSHQLKTYMAMQHAVTKLVAGVDPAIITKELEAHDSIVDKMRLPEKPSLGRVPSPLEGQFGKRQRCGDRRLHAAFLGLLRSRWQGRFAMIDRVRELPSCSTGRIFEWIWNVLVQQGFLVGRSVSAAASSAAERSLSRAPAGKASAARDAVSVGLCAARNRSGSRRAKQIRGAPRRRHDAGRYAVRHTGRQSDSRSDRRAGRRRRPDRLADDAARGANTREVDEASAESASRYIRGAETFIDSTSALRIEEEIDIAYPRLSFELRKTAKPGYMGLGIARILEVRDKNILFDEKFVPPMLVCSAHPVIDGWLNRVIGWIENKLEELARYAVDPSSGGGLQSVDYLVLQLLNRHIPVLIHFQRSSYVHPERLYEELLRLAGELATFATAERRARNYPAYDHDDLENVFAPVMRDIQDFLSAQLGRRAIRLEIIERAQNAFVSPIRDRSLFRNATLVLEVAARRPLVEIQNDFPHLFKVGPNTKMNEIVHANLPGRAAGAPADAAAAYPGHHRSRLLLPGPQVAALARVQHGGVDRDALLGRLAGT